MDSQQTVDSRGRSCFVAAGDVIDHRLLLLDAARLRENFAYVAMHGDEVALFFYSDLFLRYPELRGMFPVSMAAQRDRLVQAIGKIVSDVGHLDQLRPYLRELGRDHRKFGALPAHYDPVRASLLATLAHFSGEG